MAAWWWWQRADCVWSHVGNCKYLGMCIDYHENEVEETSNSNPPGIPLGLCTNTDAVPFIKIRNTIASGRGQGACIMKLLSLWAVLCIYCHSKSFLLRTSHHSSPDTGVLRRLCHCSLLCSLSQLLISAEKITNSLAQLPNCALN